MGEAFNLAVFAKLAPFYLGSILWTIIYDTVYAYNDRTDDIKQKLKGLAVLWGVKVISNSRILNLAQMGLFCFSSWMFDLDQSLYLLIAASSAMNDYLLKKVDLNDSRSCQRFFVYSRYYGALIAAILLT